MTEYLTFWANQFPNEKLFGFFSIHRDIVTQGNFKNLIFGFEKLIQNNKQLRLKKSGSV